MDCCQPEVLDLAGVGQTYIMQNPLLLGLRGLCERLLTKWKNGHTQGVNMTNHITKSTQIPAPGANSDVSTLERMLPLLERSVIAQERIANAIERFASEKLATNLNDAARCVWEYLYTKVD